MKIVNQLGFRLFLGITVIMLIGTAIFVTIVVDWQTQQYVDSATRFASDMSDVIAHSTRYSMMLNRQEDIYQIIKTIGSEPRIEGIRIYNKKGVVTYSTMENEVNKNVNMSAEACTGCHGSGKPTPKDTTTLTRIFPSPKGYRVMGIITPIRNDKTCSTASCHAHEASQTVLGILDVMIPLQDVDRHVAAVRNTQIVSAILLVVALIGFVLTFVRKTVSVPVHKLALGTQEIVKGNLQHHIDIATKDEIGGLATSFNRMTEELKRAHEELTAWGNNLEQRVAQKTEELRRAQAHMVHVEKMVSLGTLAATVAHELNNPLEGVLTYAKLLRRKLQNGTPSAEEAQEMISELTMIADETTRCGNIVKNLLLFSREKVGEFNDADLRAIIEQSIKLIGHHFQMHNIQLELELGDQPAIVYCDAHQLEEALLAMEINAVEAMPNSGTFRIAVRDLPSLKAVEICISDTGTGITEEDLPHIFEPFFTTKKDGKGTGLGLSVVYGIIERHRGNISVESTAAGGTTFTILIPKHHEQTISEN
ncbi:MAG TPA: ATP-binding protein [Bacteroidota bacterium]|nr:ATP-binding protein [Bacteroidota bacterium]